MPPPDHPNLALHDELFESAKEGTLNAQYIREKFNLDYDPEEYEYAEAFINWETTLALLDKKDAKVWFGGASRPGRPKGSYHLFELKHTWTEVTLSWKSIFVVKKWFNTRVEWFRFFDLEIIGPDEIRDTRSFGVYYWWYDDRKIVANVREEFCFWIDQYCDKRTKKEVLFIDVYTKRLGTVACVSLYLLLLSPWCCSLVIHIISLKVRNKTYFL